MLKPGHIKGLNRAWGDCVKMSRWVTTHGFAFNINPDLSYYENIIPCGIADKPVTSLRKILGREIRLDEVQKNLVGYFTEVFQVEFEEMSLSEIIV